MKRKLPFMNKQNGFILPYVLFILTILLLIVTTNITIYTQEINVTHTSIEHIKMQTLFQMANEKYKNEMKNNQPLQNVFYAFPDGDVAIEYSSSNLEGKFLFTIHTKNNSEYTIVKYNIPTDN